MSAVEPTGVALLISFPQFIPLSRKEAEVVVVTVGRRRPATRRRRSLAAVRCCGSSTRAEQRRRLRSLRGLPQREIGGNGGGGGCQWTPTPAIGCPAVAVTVARGEQRRRIGRAQRQRKETRPLGCLCKLRTEGERRVVVRRRLRWCVVASTGVGCRHG